MLLINDPNFLLTVPFPIFIKEVDVCGKFDEPPKFLFTVMHFCWFVNNKLHNFSCTKRRAQCDARFELTLMMIKWFLNNMTIAITFFLKFWNSKISLEGIIKSKTHEQMLQVFSTYQKRLDPSSYVQCADIVL